MKDSRLRRIFRAGCASIALLAFVGSANGQSEFSLKLHQTRDLDSLQALLDTPDPQKARLVILRIGDVFKKSSVAYLRKLWLGAAPDPSFENVHVLYDPVVRLMLAYQLQTYDPNKSYEEFIVEHLDDRRHVVQESAVEALEAIENADAVKLAHRKAYEDSFLIAWAAVDVLIRQSRKESLAGLATSALESILEDRQYPHERLKQEIVGGQGSMVLSESGRGGEKERKDGNSGSEEAELLHEYLSREEYEKAIELLLPHARAGDLDAANAVGELYLFVEPPNYEGAIEWFQYGLNRGDPAAMVSMANMYLTGRGVEKSRERAIELAGLARDKGYAQGAQLFRILTTSSE